MPRLGRIALLAIFLPYLAASAAFSQTITYPRQPAKDSGARDSDIGSYVLRRDHAAVDANGLINAVSAEVFDLEGKPRANCDVEGFDEVTTMVCTLADGNRYQVTWHTFTAEFVDFQTGEEWQLEVQPYGSTKVEATGPHVRKMGSGLWVLTGTTWEEVERRWMRIGSLFTSLLGDIHLTLGPSLPKGRAVYQGVVVPLDGQPLGSEPPANIDFCNGGAPFCNAHDPCEINHVFAGDRTLCCGGASRIADDCCRQRSGVGCCANSLCHTLCTFLCECFLDGWLLACEPPCG